MIGEYMRLLDHERGPVPIPQQNQKARALHVFFTGCWEGIIKQALGMESLHWHSSCVS